MEPALNKLVKEPQLLKHLGKIGIVANQTSTTTDFVPATEIIYAAAKRTPGSEITCVFGPQHGYFQTEQDNMRETPDSLYQFEDGVQVPLFSLYSETREPTKEQAEHIDTFVIDLQDIGCRIYTYMLTLAACLRCAAKYQKKVVVLDRANPLRLASQNSKKKWQYVEGNRLEIKWESFVGWYDIPMRHGLTLGELGKYFISHDKLNLQYSVIPVDGLTRKTNFDQLRFENWTMPSPNIPSWYSAFFFPSFVTLEGTNLSEGRGSTVPFELVGAPWLNASGCINFLKEKQILFLYDAEKPSGLFMREHHFRPTFNKHTGQICYGIQFHLNDAENINLFALGMCFLYYCAHFHAEDLKWTPPGYEYNFTDLPLNLILGSDRWFHIFQKAREKDCFAEFSSLLHAGEKEGQQFMADMESMLIYK